MNAKKIIRAVLPVALIMIVAWLGMLCVLYVVDGIIATFPAGNTPMEKIVFSLTKLAISSLVTLIWLISWFIMIAKYREKNLKCHT